MKVLLALAAVAVLGGAAFFLLRPSPAPDAARPDNMGMHAADRTPTGSPTSLTAPLVSEPRQTAPGTHSTPPQAAGGSSGLAPGPLAGDWVAEFQAMSSEERVERRDKLQRQLDERLETIFGEMRDQGHVVVVSGGLDEAPKAVAARHRRAGRVAWAVVRDRDKEQGLTNLWLADIDPSEDEALRVLTDQVDWLTQATAGAPGPH